MSAERGWIVSPRPNPNSVEAWAQRHRLRVTSPIPIRRLRILSGGTASATQMRCGPPSGAS
jgi:hypothetical protein